MTQYASGNLVLIVDDEPLNISILAETLEDQCEVIFATSGRQALDIVTNCRPDLILLDVMMPDMDGYAVFAALKDMRATADIPVIFVTGRNDTEGETRGLELGAADYIAKPVNPPVVRVRVRNQLELKHARDALHRLAVTDGLTGLFNRRSFDEKLTLEFSRLARQTGVLSVILLDVDHFKLFNDHYGHIAGDDCLRRIAGVIGETAHRAADLPARYGGEEFAYVLPDTDLNGVCQVAARLRDAVAALGIPHARSLTADHVTISLGVATGRCTTGGTPLSILARADEQLYAAKTAGRNQFCAVQLD